MPIAINGSGSITGITAGGLPDGCVTADDLASGVGGKILQVVSTTKTDASSQVLSTGALSTDLLTVSITPSNANNKILLMVSINISANNNAGQLLYLYKDSSVLTGAIGDASGSLERASFGINPNQVNPDHQSFQFLDTAGGTSAITYSIRSKFARNDSNYTISINKQGIGDSYSGYHIGRYVSTYTAMEIAA